MSYASVTAHNTPPPSKQPHADPALLNTKADIAADKKDIHLPDVDSKVTTVPNDYKEHPHTVTSETEIFVEHDETNHNGSSKRHNRKEKAHERKEDAKRALDKAEHEAVDLWHQAKTVLLRPGVLGGLLGVLNIGVLGTAGYFAWIHWEVPRWDRRVVSATTVGIVGLFAGEGYLAETYHQKHHRDHHRGH